MKNLDEYYAKNNRWENYHRLQEKNLDNRLTENQFKDFVYYVFDSPISERPGGGTSSERPGGGTSFERPGGGTSFERPGGGTSSERPGGGTSSERPGGGTSSERHDGGTSSESPVGGGTSSNDTSSVIVKPPIKTYQPFNSVINIPDDSYVKSKSPLNIAPLLNMEPPFVIEIMFQPNVDTKYMSGYWSRLLSFRQYNTFVGDLISTDNSLFGQPIIQSKKPSGTIVSTENLYSTQPNLIDTSYYTFFIENCMTYTDPELTANLVRNLWWHLQSGIWIGFNNNKEDAGNRGKLYAEVYGGINEVASLNLYTGEYFKFKDKYPDVTVNRKVLTTSIDTNLENNKWYVCRLYVFYENDKLNTQLELLEYNDVLNNFDITNITNGSKTMEYIAPNKNWGFNFDKYGREFSLSPDNLSLFGQNLPPVWKPPIQTAVSDTITNNEVPDLYSFIFGIGYKFFKYQEVLDWLNNHHGYNPSLIYDDISIWDTNNKPNDIKVSYTIAVGGGWVSPNIPDVYHKFTAEKSIDLPNMIIGNPNEPENESTDTNIKMAEIRTINFKNNDNNTELHNYINNPLPFIRKKLDIDILYGTWINHFIVDNKGDFKDLITGTILETGNTRVLSNDEDMPPEKIEDFGEKLNLV